MGVHPIESMSKVIEIKIIFSQMNNGSRSVMAAKVNEELS